MQFKSLLAGLAALSLAASGAAQTRPQAAGDFSADAFRAHVTFLADDLLEGREAGTRGYDIAARYVATQFEALGLRPGTANGWYQPVEFIRYTTRGQPTLTVAGQTYTHGREMIVRASPGAEPLAIDAPLVFAGYGLDMPSHGYNDYQGIDARGKIVVVLSGIPDGVPSDVAAHMNGDKRRMAAARGAVGMISIRTRHDIAETPWERTLRFADRPGTTWLEPDGTPFVDGSGLRFSATVNEATAAALFAGAPRSAAQVLDEAATAGSRPHGFALAQSARFAREAGESTRFSSSNVVAILPGTDPSVANEYVLLMAHLDHIGVRTTGEGDRINNGAMDNATGIATLIEVARQFSRPGNRPRRPILIAAVTAEEKGLLGAQYLSRHPVVGQGHVISVVNLDMPILTYDFQDVTAFGAEHSTMGETVRRAAARMHVGLAPDPLPEEGLFTRSDHYRFVQQGVPSVFLMTGFANGGRARFTDFLEHQYHSPRDEISLPFNWQAGARFAQLNYLIAREIADGAQAPRWYEHSFFGDAFGGQQARAPAPPQAASRPSSAAR
ncbi:MAG TPA: M28 family metallopeptidase [Allosphingosinicella sp.]|nr:M28 family metallopeptidase [Allosphingosinicella sp.]